MTHSSRTHRLNNNSSQMHFGLIHLISKVAKSIFLLITIQRPSLRANGLFMRRPLLINNRFEVSLWKLSCDLYILEEPSTFFASTDILERVMDIPPIRGLLKALLSVVSKTATSVSAPLKQIKRVNILYLWNLAWVLSLVKSLYRFWWPMTMSLRFWTYLKAKTLYSMLDAKVWAVYLIQPVKRNKPCRSMPRDPMIQMAMNWPMSGICCLNRKVHLWQTMISKVVSMPSQPVKSPAQITI